MQLKNISLKQKVIRSSILTASLAATIALILYIPWQKDFSRINVVDKLLLLAFTGTSIATLRQGNKLFSK